MKKLLSIIFALTIILAISSTVSAEYSNPFVDVPEDEWYYDEVVEAFYTGIINGKTATEFKPDDFLTYAEAVKLAACMHQLYNDGSVSLKNGNPWYQTYVDYCVDNGIIEKDYNYDDYATRAGYMVIFANALPDEALEKINNVPDNSIPDVPMTRAYSKAVYKLYRAGILQGSDAEHNCKPLDNIKRSEVAAILSRMMDETKRVKFSMETTAEKNETEEPRFEIPKDAEILPEVPEEPKVETKEETPEKSIIKVTVSGTQFTHKIGTITKVGVQAEGGTRPYTYRWQRLTDGEWKNHSSGSILPDGTFDPSFELTDSSIKTPGEEFIIKCVVTDKDRNVGESEAVTITTAGFFLEKELPDFTDMCVGKDVTLSVKVTGGKEPYTYKWYFGEFVIPTKSYTASPKFGNTPEVTFIMSGDYLPKSDNMLTSFKCEITDADGNMLLTSTGVKDTTPKDMPLSIITQPVRKTTPRYGGYLEFDIDVYGGKQPYSYEWFYESRYKNNVSEISLKTLPQTAVSRFNSEISIKLNESATLLGKEIYCVVTDAQGASIRSEKVAVCPDFLMIKLEDKTEIEGVGTEYVGTVISGEVTAGDKIGFCGFFDGKHEYVSFTVERITMFGKNLDNATSGDRVGLRASKIKTYESQEKMKEVIGESEYKTQNLAFKAIPTTLEVTVSSD